jgi:hypothetical protein
VNLRESGPMFMAPLHFVPPRCVLVSSLLGNTDSEKIKYVQIIADHWERCNQGFKHLAEIRPGKPCIIRKGEDSVRAVIVGQGMVPGTFHCICLDFNAYADMEPHDIFELPDELNTKHIASGLFLAKVHKLKWIPTKLVNEIGSVINEKFNAFRSHDVYAGYLFGMTGKDVMPDLEWVHDNSEWFSTYMTKFTDQGLILCPDANTVPMTVNALTEEVKVLARNCYDFDYARDGHPLFPAPKTKYTIDPEAICRAAKIMSLDGIAEDFQLHEKSLVPAARDQTTSTGTSNNQEREPLLPPISLSSSVDTEPNNTPPDKPLPPAQNLMSLYDWVQGALPTVDGTETKRIFKSCAIALAYSYARSFEDNSELKLILEGIASL